MKVTWLIIAQIIMSDGFMFHVKDKIKKIQKKINDELRGSEGEGLFLDVEQFEYPLNNQTLKAIHRKQWSKYYKCLEQKHTETVSEKTIRPKSLVAFEGTSVVLECRICLSPADLQSIEVVDWYYNSSSNSSELNQRIGYDEHVFASEEGNLHIFDTRPEHSGRYWCKLGATIEAPYFLHVDNSSEPVNSVHPDTATNALHATPTTIVKEYNIKLYSTWSPWSSCSTCDVVGKKKRYGYCTISLKDSKRKLKKVVPPEEIGSNDLQSLIHKTLRLFGNELPCRSAHTPMKIQSIESVKNRKSEIMVAFCKVKCPKNVIFEVRDKSGNVIESANNSAGIYSILQGLPDLMPMVSRTTIYQNYNTKCELRCPGTLNKDIPLSWKIGIQTVTPRVIEQQTAGRITISPQQYIVFTKVRYSDSNIYSCWQRNDLAGTIRLEVTKELKLKLDHHVLMTGAIAIISIFLYLFWRAFKGRKRYPRN